MGIDLLKESFGATVHDFYEVETNYYKLDKVVI
jgi:hypothetical protein